MDKQRISRGNSYRPAALLPLAIILAAIFTPGVTFAVTKNSPAAAKYEESQKLIKAKKYTEAFASIDESLKLDPEYGPALVQKAALHLLMEQFDKAEEDCREGLKYKIPKKNLSQCHKILAECYVQEGDYKRAETEMDQAIKLQPDARKNYQFRYKVCRVLKKYDKAIADCNSVLAMGSEFPASDLINRAEIYMVQKRYRDAINDYSAAIKSDEKRAERLYVDRAYAYQMVGMHNEAVADCTRALAHLSTNKANKRHDYQALKLRAESYEKLGKKDLATADRKKMAQIDDYEI